MIQLKNKILELAEKEGYTKDDAIRGIYEDWDLTPSIKNKFMKDSFNKKFEIAIVRELANLLYLDDLVTFEEIEKISLELQKKLSKWFKGVK